MCPILANADYIICPYKYQRKTIASTETFVKVVEQLRVLNPAMKAKLFLVPNFVDTRIGTKEEWEYYKQADETLSHYGTITPRVGYRAQMERANTYAAEVSQKHAVYDAFNFIMKQIRKEG